MDARSLPWTTPAPNEAATNVWEAARAEQRCAELKRDPLSVVDDVLRLRATWGVTAGVTKGAKRASLVQGRQHLHVEVHPKVLPERQSNTQQACTI